MREIKFRVWSVTERNMEYGRDLTFYFSDDLSDAVDHEYYKLMQYTGLTDKNGKEIYEGDILYTTGLYQENFIVEYCKHGFELYGWRDGVLCDPNAEWENYGVIGNIYENPELLEVK